MSMKLREDVPVYEVCKHGNVYVEPNTRPVAVCPECCSTNVKGPLVKSLYTCNDCNCEFFMDVGSMLTKKGKFLRVLMYVLSTLSFVAILAVFIGAVLWLDHMEDKLGEEFVQSTYTVPTALFTIIGMIVLCFLGCKCGSLVHKI